MVVLYGFSEVAEDGTEIWGTLAGSMTAVAAYSFLRIQPSLCTMLCSNGSYQKRNEQYKMVLVCNWISDPACLCCISVYLPDRHPGNRRWIRNRCSSSNPDCDRILIHALPSIQREPDFKC